MKTFRYALGHEAGKTMTVNELMEKLAGYPGGMPVLATWEGTRTWFDPESFSIVQGFHCGNEEDACDCLEIDVNDY